jgi:hypothetical protein
MDMLNQISSEAIGSRPVPSAPGPAAESLSRRNFLQATAAVAGACGNARTGGQATCFCGTILRKILPSAFPP